MKWSLGIVLALCLWAPANAVAADWYVATPANGGSNANPCSQAAPCATIQYVDLLAAVQDGDTIHIGPGEFAANLLIGKRLTLEGSGGGTTTSFDPATDTFVNASAASAQGILMTDGGALRRLRVQGGQGGSDATPPYPAIDLRPTAASGTFAYDVQGVVAIGGAKGTVGRPGLQISDNGSGAAKTVTATVGGDSYFTVPIGTTAAVLAQGANTEAALSSTTVAGPQGGTGVSSELGASVSLVGSNVIDSLGQATGVRALGGGAAISVTSSTVSARTYGLYSSNYAGTEPASATISDSLLRVDKQAAAGIGVAARIVAGSNRSVRLDVRQSTLVASGPNVTAAVQATAGTNAHADAALANTVAQATDTDSAPGDADLVASGAGAVIAASYSHFNDRTATGGATVAAPESSTNVAGPPGFGAPDAANYLPEPGSPLIDRGDPALVAPGALDLSGGPRVADGNGDCVLAPDIGAYEAPEAGADCRPRLLVSARPVRLTARGTARIKATCPPGALSPCDGTVALRSRFALRPAPKRRKRAKLDFGSTQITLAPGTSALVPVTLSKRNRKILRRYGMVRAIATARLTDPVHGEGVTQARLKLLAPPRRLAVKGGRLAMRPGGGVRLRLTCAAWEIEPCAGTIGLRAGGQRLGGGPVSVPAGSTRSKTFHLTPAARALVRRAGALRVRIVVVSRSGRTKAKQTKRARLHATRS